MTRRLCDQVRSLRLALTLCASIGLGGSGIGARPAWGDTAPAPATAKPRARDLGVPFEGQPGPHNAITDVPGVEVGHVTLIAGSGPLSVGKGPIRTGVTAILPRGKTARPLSVAAVVCLNGNGELTGSHWVNESGLLESPILLTNTDSVGVVRDAVIAQRVHAGGADASGYWWSLPGATAGSHPAPASMRRSLCRSLPRLPTPSSTTSWAST